MAELNIHNIKIRHKDYKDILDGRKRFDIRNNGNAYSSMLELKNIRAKVVYISRGIGLWKDFVVLGFEVL